MLSHYDINELLIKSNFHSKWAKIGYDVSAPMIIGGNVAAEAQFPWQISQRRIQGGQPGSHMCGGSLAGKF